MILGTIISTVSAFGLGIWATYLKMRPRPRETVEDDGKEEINPSPVFPQGAIVEFKIKPVKQGVFVWVKEYRPDKGNLLRICWQGDSGVIGYTDENVYALRMVKSE